MLFALFVTLLALSLVLIALGNQTKEGVYSLIGFSLMFILAAWIILPGNLELPNGQTINTNYTYNNITTLTDTYSTETPSYVAYNDTSSRVIGLWLALVSIAGFAISVNEIKRGRFPNE